MKSYNLKALFLSFAFMALSTLPVYCEQGNGLIEYSYGSYGDFGASDIGIPMLWPPLVKIYQDGKIIFYVKADDKFYVGQIEAEQLERLKKKLKQQQFLRQSRFIEMKGDFINIHGGVSYIRYLDGDNEVLLSTEASPRGGTWVKIIKLIREYLPVKYSLYYPEKIGLQSWEDKDSVGQSAPPAWPFSKEVQLSSKPETISNPEIIRYLFERLEGSFSFFNWEFREEGKRYVMVLEKVPSWYNDGNLKFALAQLRWDWKNKQKEKEGAANK
jgi:hypothetical protein